MKQRSILNETDLTKAVADMANLKAYIPFVITITEGTKIRSNSQNARHWADITHFMEDIANYIEETATFYGNTDIEMRRIVAEGMPVEHAVILFARKPEVVHEVLKSICNIPTSTRLGTKEFSKFDDILAKTMMEILSEIRSAVR